VSCDSSKPFCPDMRPAWLSTLAFALASGRSLVSERDGEALASRYLHRYGYTQSDSAELSPLTSLESSIRKFQNFAGLEETGLLTNETMHLMKTPRCGVKDNVKEDDPGISWIKVRTKRYALQGSRWRVKDLSYRISKYPSSSILSRSQVDRTMRKAFDVWSRVTDLKFEEKRSGKVHIEIRFERRSHGDDDPFDGEGGTLAHAFFPVFGGDVHFDEEEDWTVDTPKGTSLLMSAAHELGHSLGLSHSTDRGALMAPFYRGYEKNPSLAQDDIDGIEALYGKKEGTDNDDDEDNDNAINSVRGSFLPSSTTRTTTPRRPPPTTSGINNRELCGSKLDVLITLYDDTTYAFKGNKYWKLTETSVEPGYPRSISANWEGLPGNLDAAFTWTNGRSYFFKGSQYWRFTDGSRDAGYPKDMSAGFSGIPSNIDAAFVWPFNDKIYFFKGSKYWKFDPEAQPPVDDSYPRDASNWDGIPDNLDTALQYSNDKVYFFKDGQYYRWDDESFSVDETANPGFPRDTGFWWFGCKSNNPLVKRPEDYVDYY